MEDFPQPLNVLFYSEPHPIRNSYTEHLHIIRTLMEPLQNFATRGLIRLRLFSNHQVIDRCVTESSQWLHFFQGPTGSEVEQIDTWFQQWNDNAIGHWLDLVCGRGEITDFYTGILERLHAEDPIDLVLCWSENGAVRRFREKHGVPVLFGELGPTRSPLTRTMYFDPVGTNGHASFRARVREAIEQQSSERVSAISSSLWLLPSERGSKNQSEVASLIDRGVTYSAEYEALLPERPYIYVPLQLADDLNTLIHSEFGTPLEFADHMCRLAQENGYNVVLKGHPGAEARSYNLRREIEALDHITETFPEAVILSRTCGHDLSNYVMANAAYSASINSSVSFESMVLGVPALALGAAAYDADGWLAENIRLLPADQPRDFQSPINALIGAHMESVFVPQDVVTTSDYLYDRIEQLVRNPEKVGKPVTSSLDLMAWYLTGQTNGLAIESQRQAIPYIGSPGGAQGTPIVQTAQTLTLQLGDRPVDLVLQRANRCVGRIETVEGDDKGQVLTGWIVDTRTMRPPLMLIIVHERKFSSHHRLVVMREDVSTYLKLAQPIRCGFRFVLQSNKLAGAELWAVTFDGHVQGPIAIKADAGFQADRPESGNEEASAKRPAGGQKTERVSASVLAALGTVSESKPAGVAAIRAGDGLKITDSVVTISGPALGTDLSLKLSTTFRGHIESIDRSKPGRISIRGWALCGKEMVAPHAVFLASNGTIVASSAGLETRQDLARHFKLSQMPVAGFAFDIGPLDLATARLLVVAPDGGAFLTPDVREKSSFG